MKIVKSSHTEKNQFSKSFTNRYYEERKYEQNKMSCFKVSL